MGDFKFRSAPKILNFRDPKTKNTQLGAIKKSLIHNFRQTIPENVDPEFKQFNAYFVGKWKKTFDDENEAYQKAKIYRKELMDLAKKSWDEQQAKYSQSKRQSFNDFSKKHVVYQEIVLPNTRQEWFEKMGICKFSDIFVEDKFTGKRKMGKLIADSINWEKMDAWVKAEINFVKQWLTKKFKTSKGFVYASLHLDETTPHLHVGIVPISKKFSKELNKDRWVLSATKGFHGKDVLYDFHEHHAAYLTKAGFEILAGERGSQGSYGGIGFKEVKALEKEKLNQEVEDLIKKVSAEKQNYNNFKKMLDYRDYYLKRIDDIRNYLKLDELDEYEKNQLARYLEVLEKVQYYKLMDLAYGQDYSDKNMLENYQNEMDQLTIKLQDILSKSYSLIN